jgi:hypothetical protein
MRGVAVECGDWVGKAKENEKDSMESITRASTRGLNSQRSSAFGKKLSLPLPSLEHGLMDGVMGVHIE